jgi:hypothetical protein
MKITPPSPLLPSVIAKKPTASLQVRTDLRAGAWNCANCQGQVNGNQMFKPKCEYCQPA